MIIFISVWQYSLVNATEMGSRTSAMSFTKVLGLNPLLTML